MPSQNSLVKDARAAAPELDFDGVTISEGELHTIQDHNNPGWVNLGQRGRNPDDDFKLSVELIRCVHGLLEEDKEDEASLIVVEYNLRNRRDPFHYSSFYTEFTFDPKPSSGQQPEYPSVMECAPFRKNKRFEVVDVQVDLEKYAKLKVGGEGAGAKAEAEGGVSQRESFVKGYYIRCQSSSSFNPAKNNLKDFVWWQMDENKKTKSGVPATLRVAILVQRPPRSKALFVGKFKVDLEAGFGLTLNRTWKRLTRDKELKDDPVVFDPSEPPVGGDGIDEKNLGKYRGDALEELTIVFPN
jgi:hypothetical protein